MKNHIITMALLLFNLLLIFIWEDNGNYASLYKVMVVSLDLMTLPIILIFVLSFFLNERFFKN